MFHTSSYMRRTRVLLSVGIAGSFSRLLFGRLRDGFRLTASRFGMGWECGTSEPTPNKCGLQSRKSLVLRASRYWPIGPFNPKRKATGRRAVHLDVVNLFLPKESFHGRFEFSVGYILQPQKMAAPAIGFQRARAAAQFFGKTRIALVARTDLFVNIHRPRLWQSFDACEPVVSEQDPAIPAGHERAQAMAARGIVGGQLRMSWKTVKRSAHRSPHFFDDFGRNRHHSNGNHNHDFLNPLGWSAESHMVALGEILRQRFEVFLSGKGRQTLRAIPSVFHFAPSPIPLIMRWLITKRRLESRR